MNSINDIFSEFANIVHFQILFVKLIGPWISGDWQGKGTRRKKVEIMQGEEGEGEGRRKASVCLPGDE